MSYSLFCVRKDIKHRPRKIFLKQTKLLDLSSYVSKKEMCLFSSSDLSLLYRQRNILNAAHCIALHCRICFGIHRNPFQLTHWSQLTGNEVVIYLVSKLSNVLFKCSNVHENNVCRSCSTYLGISTPYSTYKLTRAEKSNEKTHNCRKNRTLYINRPLQPTGISHSTNQNSIFHLSLWQFMFQINLRIGNFKNSSLSQSLYSTAAAQKDDKEKCRAGFKEYPILTTDKSHRACCVLSSLNCVLHTCCPL